MFRSFFSCLPFLRRWFGGEESAIPYVVERKEVFEKSKPPQDEKGASRRFEDTDALQKNFRPPSRHQENAKMADSAIIITKEMHLF